MSVRLRRFVLELSDLHCGHELGLLAPGTVLIKTDADGSEKVDVVGAEDCTQMGSAQHRLWSMVQEHRGLVEAIVGKMRVDVLVKGDVGNGLKYADGLCIYDRLNQARAAAECIRRYVKNLKVGKVRFVHGTPAHTAGDTIAILCARELRYQDCFDVDVCNHGLYTVGGAVFDVAHHGPGQSSRKWLKGNTARYYLRSCMLEDIGDDLKPADVYSRGHVHTWIHEAVSETWRGSPVTSQIVVSPSYSYVTPFARQVMRSISRLVNGGVLYQIEGGRVVEVHPILTKTDIRTKETL